MAVEGNSRKNKIIVPKLKKEGEYCCNCHDGGSIVLCDLCESPWCYDVHKESGDNVQLEQLEQEGKVLDSAQDNTVEGGCVTVHGRLIGNPDWIFRCPTCASQNLEWNIDYKINNDRGYVHRLEVNAKLVIIMATLPQHEERGLLFYQMIKAQLGAFEMDVEYHLTFLPYVLRPGILRTIKSSKYQYHLVLIFLTESDLCGGWCFDSVESELCEPNCDLQTANAGPALLNGVQTSEGDLLRHLLESYHGIAETALSARVFGLCCGLNLTVPGVLDEITKVFKSSNWTSIVLPTVPSLMPEVYFSIFPEAFTKMYHLSTPVEPAFVKAWAKSNWVRAHTGLLIVDRCRSTNDLAIRKYTYAPASSATVGIDMPTPQAYCECRSDDGGKWKRPNRPLHIKHREYFLTFNSGCGCTILYLAVFAEGFRRVKICGTHVVVQPYCPKLGGFPLDRRDWFLFRATEFDQDRQQMNEKPQQAKKAKRLDYSTTPPVDTFFHTSSWTEAAQQAVHTTRYDGYFN